MPPKSKMSTFNQPYLHYSIPNFLPSQLYSKLLNVYEHLEFKEKQNDLFHFFQTLELANNPKLEFFKKQLDNVFWSLKPMSSGEVEKKDTSYSIFASYYFENNYLLCHDDVIDDRKYAFSYYLQDHPSGHLVFYNSEANKEVKRISVKKNTLVIFEVSNISYHQVDICHTDGRKAVTGWFNIKGLGAKREQKVIPPFSPSLPTNQILTFPLNYTEEEYFHLMDVQYQFNVEKEQQKGPFYSRKIMKLEISPSVIFEIDNYQLYSADFYKVRKGDYILLNDPVNTIQTKNQLLDIFVTCLPQSFETEEESMLIKIIEKDGELSGIPEIHDSVFMVKRDEKQYYIDCNQKEFMFAHFIYQKKEKKVKKKENKKVVQGSFVPANLSKGKPKKSKNKSQKKKVEKSTGNKGKTKPINKKSNKAKGSKKKVGKK